MASGYGRVTLDFIPSHEAGVPLQAPSEVHLRILDPLRIKPSSQSKDTSWGNTVRLPNIDPFDGASIGPQSLAKTRGWQNNFHIPKTNKKYRLRG